jgi:hypothetical protein
LSKGGHEFLFWGVETRHINVCNGKGEVVRAPGEGRSDREIVNGMVKKLQPSVIPNIAMAPEVPTEGLKTRERID